jgi:hypothetical protein
VCPARQRQRDQARTQFCIANDLRKLAHAIVLLKPFDVDGFRMHRVSSSVTSFDNISHYDVFLSKSTFGRIDPMLENIYAKQDTAKSDKAERRVSG